LDNSLFIKKIMNAIPVGERTNSSDFSIFTNAFHKEELQRVAFFDSRGKKTLPDNSPDFIASLLAEYWEKKQEKYLILTRTHASTTFFTLLNFLNNLQIKTPYLLTNVGIVDFMPKKKIVIDDILLQARELFIDVDLKIVDLEEFQLASGSYETLIALELNPLAEDIGKRLSIFCDTIIMIGTHEVPSSTSFSRARPPSFYSQIKETNKFLKLVSKYILKKHFILNPCFVNKDIKETVFDGVHLTKEAHVSLFQKLLSHNLI
jgi:hypothetical protein